MAQEEAQPQLPVAISAIDNKYLLFDIEVITWLRKHHHICGVFIGTLPQNPSQNVFMGLPMEIMPEEAQLLVELGLGYILDDARAHDAALAKANRSRRQMYVSEAEGQASGISVEKAREKDIDRKRAIKKSRVKSSRKSSDASSATTVAERVSEPLQSEDLDPIDSLFSLPEEQQQTSPSRPTDFPLTITPTASTALLPPTSPLNQFTTTTLLPGLTPSSYNLYRHLHNTTTHKFTSNSNYYMTPGLRFGCQFCVYPGDPLRFHSHFLGVGVDWDEEIELMDIVGGGRLGTGVKKGWLVGGMQPAGVGREGEMRTFTVEWAAM